MLAQSPCGGQALHARAHFCTPDSKVQHCLLANASILLFVLETASLIFLKKCLP